MIEPPLLDLEVLRRATVATKLSVRMTSRKSPIAELVSCRGRIGMTADGKAGRALKILVGASALNALGVIGGFLAALNVLRLARIHVDGGVPLTRWAIVQIQVGHVFVQYGWILLALATAGLGTLWLGFFIWSLVPRSARREVSP
jgi:hypothetical protein